MKRFTLVALVLLLSMFSLFAENFVINEYVVDIDVSQDRVYTITETILMNFTTPSHGFYRDIPYIYRNDRVIKAVVDNISVSAPFEKEKNGDYISLKIGDPDKYVSGPVEYTISYTYDLGEDQYPDYDEFYYNIIGDMWDTTISNILFRIKFPSPIDKDRIWYTSGLFGSTSFVGKTSLEMDDTVIVGYVPSLGAKSALTVRVEMDEGYFVGAREIKDYSLLAGIITIILAIAIAVYFILSYTRYGIDDPLAVVVNFDAPKGLTPLECGYLIDESADDKDVGAMIFYWADKGYLTIEETDKKGDDFIFHKKKDLDDGATENERKLFSALFKAGDDVDIDKLGKSQFAKTVNENVKPGVGSYFKGDRGLLEVESSKKARTMTFLAVFYILIYSASMCITDLAFTFFTLFCAFFFLCISLLFASKMKKQKYIKKFSRLWSMLIYIFISFICVAFTYGYADKGNTSNSTTVGATVALVVVTLLGSYGANAMQKRSEYGKHTMENVLGYKEFIDKVEVDKLKMLIEQDPEYFYHVLSFAICFGLEDKWAKKFNNILIQPASWYYSPYNVATDYLFYSSLYRRMNNTYKNQVVPASYPRSTSGHGGSSTFSGSSGFSGGGFGGGGGRSW